ncbi:hypothetical protein RND71_028340 [Anisodus tanguticus]|uniref:GDSL esterase/lipase n=1 Tax=Anisodus tanguticus TaxID=243964 RepID=A0AAE1V2J8_9SOLA|nr:hypothetical protein RND71_028340 [Anisodus tanguticus]
MANEHRVFCWTIFVMFLLVNVATCQDALAPEGAGGRRGALVPAMFIFGDSLIDNGTELLGLPLMPAHSGASADQMRFGVNYASAAAGILDNTGRNFQIKNFENTLDQITDNLGAPDVAQALAKCMFFVGMGSNDYLNNYLMPNYDTKSRYNAQQYANLLVQQNNQQLTRLYNLGARKFVIGGVGLMGCIPSILAQSNSNGCSEEVNQLVLPFSDNVQSMLKQFKCQSSWFQIHLH